MTLGLRAGAGELYVDAGLSTVLIQEHDMQWHEVSIHDPQIDARHPEEKKVDNESYCK